MRQSQPPTGLPIAMGAHCDNRNAIALMRISTFVSIPTAPLPLPPIHFPSHSLSLPHLKCHTHSLKRNTSCMSAIVRCNIKLVSCLWCQEKVRRFCHLTIITKYKYTRSILIKMMLCRPNHWIRLHLISARRVASMTLVALGVVHRGRVHSFHSVTSTQAHVPCMDFGERRVGNILVCP